MFLGVRVWHISISCLQQGLVIYRVSSVSLDSAPFSFSYKKNDPFPELQAIESKELPWG